MNYRIITVAALLVALPAVAQKKKTVVNDSNTPLHLLQPAYQGTYGDLSPEQVKKDIDRVFNYIDKETPARVVDKNTGKVITDYTTMGDEAQLERGAFRLASYEWGVTYSACMFLLFPLITGFILFWKILFTVSVLRLRMLLIISLPSLDSTLVRNCGELNSEDVKYLKSK